MIPPMTTVAKLLSEIEAYCKGAEIRESTFGTKAVNDGKFVARLREGAGVTVATVERVRAYIAQRRTGVSDLRGEKQ